MGRRRKKHTHVDPVEREGDRGVPRTLVFRRGRLGDTALQLIRDLRSVFLPNTALNLKERRANTLKDFVHVSSQLGVTHFMMLSSTDVSTYLKGPTLTFKVSSYSLARDVRRAQAHPRSAGPEFRHAPVLVLSGMGDATERHMQLAKTTFKDMFPTIAVNSARIEECQRTVLVSYDAASETFELRHYYVGRELAGVSEGVQALVQHETGDLSRYEDVADYVLSHAAPVHSASVVDVAVGARRQRVATQRVRLQELGPRVTMQLLKVEEGLGEGATWYHRYVNKTAAEIAEQEERQRQRRALREARRREQAARVAAKGDAPAADAPSAEESAGEVVDENLEWYRREVGEEPDEEALEALRANAPQEKKKKKKKTTTGEDGAPKKKSKSDKSDRRDGGKDKKREKDRRKDKKDEKRKDKKSGKSTKDKKRKDKGSEKSKGGKSLKRRGSESSARPAKRARHS